MLVIGIILVFIAGAITGISLMCVVQINRDNYKDKKIKELEDELAMSEYLKKLKELG